jgi:hypothetical protein
MVEKAIIKYRQTHIGCVGTRNKITGFYVYFYPSTWEEIVPIISNRTLAGFKNIKTAIRSAVTNCKYLGISPHELIPLLALSQRGAGMDKQQLELEFKKMTER